ncbi:MAG: hypothetical protein V3V72_03150 [Ignavibacteriaceae bacterium]
MERIFNKAKNNKKAAQWDVLQQISMSPEERMKVAKELKNRYYGNNPPDVRSRKK